ncbi:MAG: hypothetical protein ACOYB8_01345 [Eubacteriaceae bacterium]|jgi:hypothetical protein
MENFRKKVSMRIIGGTVYCCIVVLLMVLSAVDVLPHGSASDFALGFSVGIGMVALVFIIKSILALRNARKLEDLYIEEKDERREQIFNSVGRTSLVVILYVLSLAMLVSGFYNATVFKTLQVVVIGIALVSVILKLYYSHKY